MGSRSNTPISLELMNNMQIYETIVSYGHGPLDATYLCIHETANPGATAYDHLRFWTRDDTYAVHYVCDWKGRVYHCVPDDCKCNQVGNGNPYVIGLEICHATSQEDFEKAWKTAVEWTRHMLDKYGWGIDRVLSHDDCRRLFGGTDHTDPLGYFWEYGKSFAQFKQEVEELGEVEMITDDDITRIAKASTNYVWGFEKGGRSMVNWMVNMPTTTTSETLGYTNPRMNGNKDVYQLLTDAVARADDASRKAEVAVSTLSAVLDKLNDIEKKLSS